MIFYVQYSVTGDIHMGCSIDATSFLDSVCTLKQSCEYFVVGPDLLATQPCPPGLAAYLDVQYKCVKGNGGFHFCS